MSETQEFKIRFRSHFNKVLFSFWVTAACIVMPPRGKCASGRHRLMYARTGVAQGGVFFDKVGHVREGIAWKRAGCAQSHFVAIEIAEPIL